MVRSSEVNLTKEGDTATFESNKMQFSYVEPTAVPGIVFKNIFIKIPDKLVSGVLLI